MGLARTSRSLLPLAALLAAAPLARGAPTARPSRCCVRVPRALPALAVRPNPARHSVVFLVDAPASGARPAAVEIFDVRGRLVRSLPAPGGRAEIPWDGRDASGAPAGSGVYFARLTAGGTSVVRRWAWIR